MAVPSSGELKLWDDIWNNEIGGTQGNNSLHSASVYAEFSTPDAMSDFYGWSDIELPTVDGIFYEYVTYYSVRPKANLASTGNSTSVARGFYIGTTANPYSSNAKYSAGTTSNTGQFCYNLNASSNTTYYAWAYACNEAGEVVSGRICCRTPYPPFTPTYGALRSGCAYASTKYGAGGVAHTSTGYVNPYSGGYATVASNHKTGYGQYADTIFLQSPTNSLAKWCVATSHTDEQSWADTIACEQYPYNFSNVSFAGDAGSGGYVGCTNDSGRIIHSLYGAYAVPVSGRVQWCYN